MKTSTIILLSALGAILILTLAGLLGLRWFLGRTIVAEESPEGSVQEVERVFDLTGYTRIATEGLWQIEASPGESHSLTVTVPEYLNDKVDVRLHGDTLALTLVPGARIRADSFPPRAQLRLPELRGITTSGAADLQVKGFDVHALALTLDGGTNLEAQDCRIESLEVRASGAARIDMQDSVVVNADIDMSGAGVMEITMGGGELEADLSGVSNLDYRGTVSRTRIRRSGASMVTGP
jgi:hypothetical protein